MGTLRKCVERYGDVVLLPFSPPTYFINDPADIKHVLVTNSGNYHKTRALRIGRRIFGNGLLTSEKPFHTDERRILQPLFTKQSIVSFGKLMVDTTLEHLERSWCPRGVIDISEEVTRITLSIVTKALFGIDVSSDSPKLRRALTIAQRHIERQNKLGITVPEHWPTLGNLRYKRAVALFDHVFEETIRRRKSNHTEQRDLLSLILEAAREDPELMNEKQIRDETVTFLLAGLDTTANGLVWTLYLLATHSDVEQKLLEELDLVLAGAPPDVSHLPMLKYTAMVFAESLRLYPPVWRLGRTAINADHLPSGVPIPAHSEIVIHTFITHRDPRYYNHPDQFIPERFSAEAVRTRPQFSYFPFGGGPRICIGGEFAKMEAALVIAAAMQRYKMHLVPGQRIIPEPLITLRPRHGIKMFLELRGNQRGMGNEPRHSPARAYSETDIPSLGGEQHCPEFAPLSQPNAESAARR